MELSIGLAQAILKYELSEQRYLEKLTSSIGRASKISAPIAKKTEAKPKSKAVLAGVGRETPMLGKIKKVVMIAVSLLVTACATSKLDVISTSPIVAFNEAQVDAAINNANWSSDLKVGETSLDNGPFLSFYKLLFGLDDVRPHSALAVGYPYECAQTNSVYRRSSETSAARAALNAVLSSARTMAKHSGKECGARLVLLNNKLLIRPDELPDKVNVAYVLKGQSVDGTEEVTYGIIQHQGTGKNLPLAAFNNDGEKVCDGIYSLSILQAFRSGKFKIKCSGDQFSGELEGNFEFRGNILISKGQLSDGGDYEFYVGMSINAYQARTGDVPASQLQRYMADTSVLLDFNTLHDGEKPNNNMVIDAYYAGTGVTFVKMNSTDRQGPVITTSGGDTCRYGSPIVVDRSRAKPPDNDPFNVRIEFSIPVRSVSADVFAGPLDTGATMTAYDSKGNILDSIESRYEGFAKGRLGISSDTPIAAVEWVSSNGLRSGVGIDNLMFGPMPNGQERTHIPPSKPVNEVVFVNGKMGCGAIQG